MGNVSPDGPWPALRRCWIEHAAYAAGGIQRGEISAALGISLPQATADLQRLLQEHPGCLTYNLTLRRYQWTGGPPRLPVPEFLHLLFPTLHAPGNPT